MNKKKIIRTCVVIFVIIFVAVCIAIVQFSKHALEETKKGLNKSQEKYGPRHFRPSRHGRRSRNK